MPWFVLLENNANEWKRKKNKKLKKGKSFLDVEKKNFKVRNFFFSNEMQEIGAIGLIIRKFQKKFQKNSKM